MPAQVINSQSAQQRILPSLSMKKKVLISSVLAIIAAVSFGVYMYNKPHQSIAGEQPAFKLNASALVAEYDQSEKLANSKYLGKIIEVEGVVAEKLKDKNGKINVTLEGAELAGVGCEFEPSAQKIVSSFKEGQKVSIKGICTGVLMDVVLVDCVCVSKN